MAIVPKEVIRQLVSEHKFSSTAEVNKVRNFKRIKGSHWDSVFVNQKVSHALIKK